MEVIAWNDLLIHLGLQVSFRANKFRKVSPKIYAWDNRRTTPNMICSRLDRFYMNQNLIKIGGQTAIWPTLAHVFDHAPVFVRLQPRNNRSPRKPEFNRYLLTNDTEKELLLAVWYNMWCTRFVECLKAIKQHSDQQTTAHHIQRKVAFVTQLIPIFEAKLAL